MPTKRTVDQIKARALLRPALTSHFEVEIPTITSNKRKADFDAFLKGNDVLLDQEKLNLLCSEASLPGSALSTYDIVDDYTGVNEKHAYRRLYDDRIDFTFYVDAENYLPIKYFEAWIKWIVDESNAGGNGSPLGTKSKAYFYRMKYPDDYVCDSGLKVRKFERDYGPGLEYEFIRAYPISVTSMPVSYDASSLLKCSVSFTYLRYVVGKSEGVRDQNKDAPAAASNPQNQALTPQQQASLNKVAFNPTAFSTNQLSSVPSVGGVNYSAALASGNTGKGITQFDIANAVSAERTLINQNK
jgi:hypothetical protein